MVPHRNHSTVTVAFTLLLFTTTVTGVTHIVGDSIWSIPPTTDFYKDWASSRTFHIGDTLRFEFETEMYNIVKVQVWEHDLCWDKIIDMLAVRQGPWLFNLTHDGGFYFVCTMFNYCSLGLKLAVYVNGNAPSTDVLDGEAA